MLVGVFVSIVKKLLQVFNAPLWSGCKVWTGLGVRRALIFEIIQTRSTHEKFQDKEEFRPKFSTVAVVAVVAAVLGHPLQSMVVQMYLERPLPLKATGE